MSIPMCHPRKFPFQLLYSPPKKFADFPLLTYLYTSTKSSTLPRRAALRRQTRRGGKRAGHSDGKEIVCLGGHDIKDLEFIKRDLGKQIVLTPAGKKDYWRRKPIV